MTQYNKKKFIKFVKSRRKYNLLEILIQDWLSPKRESATTLLFAGKYIGFKGTEEFEKNESCLS